MFVVKGNREESNEQTKSLKEEVIGRLEKTRDQISEVEGRTSSSISEVYENINSAEGKHTASIAELNQSIVVSWEASLIVTECCDQTMEKQVEDRLEEKVQLLLFKGSKFRKSNLEIVDNSSWTLRWST